MSRTNDQNAVMRSRRGPAMKNGATNSIAKTATSEAAWTQCGKRASHQLVQMGIGCVK